MTAKECIKGRRSIRKFQDKPVSHDVLAQVVETASFAPSWKNTQITRYIAVEGELKNKIAADCTTPYPKNGEHIANAPMVIAITVLKNRCGYERDGSFTTPRKDTWQMFDAGIATQSFCLAAHELGLGTVILGIFDEAKAAAYLELPEDRELIALVPIGYPAEEPTAPMRKTVEDLLSYK
ncbi:MAG: nitroreductase family protein [Lachnospiraceae bacterium]|nr:nitroreductase family protein [Lachnospiraceae bacterium]